jgi:hemoglobin
MSHPLPDGEGSPPNETAAVTLPPVPSLYEWAGGMIALERLTARFYDRVRDDAVLAPIFAGMDSGHPRHVALFIAEVLRGPAAYTAERGGHATMIARHLNKRLTNAQRVRWVALLLDCADEVGVPDDPEFRSAFAAYLEWGSRLAVLNSREGAAPALAQPMPSWGWGEVGGPYRG